jgi:anti-anti-sigma regulatory factor
MLVVIRELDLGIRVSRCARCVRTRILQSESGEHIRAVVLDAETVPFLDVTAARMLAQLIDELRAHRRR